MAKVTKQVEVSKEADELISALAEIILVSKTALEDGFQAGADIPAIVMGAWPKLATAIQGIELLDDEMKEDKAAFAKALGLGVADIVDVLMKKPAQAV